MVQKDRCMKGHGYWDNSCLIGRIHVGNQYGIVDRRYGAEKTEFLGTEDGFESEDKF